jgi:4-amino-4-deoxy-L-arabinose transferase-like glycosyltransferase
MAEPYAGDPYGYLRQAGKERRFYEGSVREPLFVFLVKIGLFFTGGADHGVSVASASSSVLLCLATYLLGSYAFTPATGLVAATLMAVEQYVVGLSVEGWRDDTFALLVVLWTYLLLRFRDRMSWGRAVTAGVVAGAACLTRITALSFILPGYAAVFFFTSTSPARIRLTRVGLSLGVGGALLAPYLINCAIEFGDPLYSINYHTKFYLPREKVGIAAPVNWLDFLRLRFRPAAFLETLLVGVTSYPYSNKWNGFDYWMSGLGFFLSRLALVGGLLMLWLGKGRILLFVAVCSLLPYAFTYQIRGGSEWRFTLHAYPFYLIAAVLALSQMAAVVRLVTSRKKVERLAQQRRMAIRRIAATAALLGTGWVVATGVHYLQVRESILGGESTRVHAGAFDALFFGNGWSWPDRRGNIVARASRGGKATLWLPLAGNQAYRLDLRMDPYPRTREPATVVRILVNGSVVSELRLGLDPRRMESYSVMVPSSLVSSGRNRIDLEAYRPHEGTREKEAPGAGFLLWFVRVTRSLEEIASSRESPPQ